MSARDLKTRPELRLVGGSRSDAEPLLNPADAAREQLTLVMDGQRQLAKLAAQVASLEVDCIEADVGVGQSAAGLQLSPQDAAKLGILLARKHALEQELAKIVGKPESHQSDDELLPRLDEAIEALGAWLEAPHVKESKRAATLARVVLLMGTFIVGWAAYIFHPALMVLIIPVAGPISLILRRGENTQWRRMGAKQRYERSRQTEPHEWQEEAVMERLEELKKERHKRANRALTVADVKPNDEVLDERFAELTYEQVDIDLTLERALRAAGLNPDELDDAKLSALDRAAKAAQTRQQLEQVRKQRAALKQETERRKDDIFRFLSAQGFAPDGGRADVEALNDGLNALQQRS